MPIANNFLPELGGPWRQGETVLHTLQHFKTVYITLNCITSSPLSPYPRVDRALPHPLYPLILGLIGHYLIPGVPLLKQRDLL
ncbi:hypothetical protein ES703_56259 [subsurface metagenome]